MKAYILIMNDQGTEIPLGYFESEELANSTIGSINLLPKEPQEFYGEAMEMRAFKLDGVRHIDQGAEYFVREVEINESRIEPVSMTIAQFMAEEQEANHKPYIDANVKTDDLC